MQRDYLDDEQNGFRGNPLYFQPKDLRRLLASLTGLGLPPKILIAIFFACLDEIMTLRLAYLCSCLLAVAG